MAACGLSLDLAVVAAVAPVLPAAVAAGNWAFVAVAGPDAA